MERPGSGRLLASEAPGEGALAARIVERVCAVVHSRWGHVGNNCARQAEAAHELTSDGACESGGAERALRPRHCAAVRQWRKSRCLPESAPWRRAVVKQHRLGLGQSRVRCQEAGPASGASLGDRSWGSGGGPASRRRVALELKEVSNSDLSRGETPNDPRLRAQRLELARVRSQVVSKVSYASHGRGGLEEQLLPPASQSTATLGGRCRGEPPLCHLWSEPVTTVGMAAHELVLAQGFLVMCWQENAGAARIIFNMPKVAVMLSCCAWRGIFEARL